MTRFSCDARPETCGLLDEPPRLPPTAVGAATSPSPPDRYSRRLGPTRRIALAFLAIVFAMTALPAFASGSAPRSTFAASLTAASVDAGLQAMTATAHPWREVVAPAALRALQSVAALPQTLARHRGSAPTRGSESGPLVLDEQMLSRRRRS
jgi:hypothetical protein